MSFPPAIPDRAGQTGVTRGSGAKRGRGAGRRRCQRPGQCGISPSRRRAAARPRLQASPGQFFQLLCPQPAGEQPFLRRPMSLYGAECRKRGKSSFSTRSPAPARAGSTRSKAGDRLDIMGPLGTGFTLDPALAPYRRRRPRRRPGDARAAGAGGAQQAGIGVTAVFSARRPELVVSVDLFRSHGADVIVVTDSEIDQRTGQCRTHSPRPDCGGPLRCVLHLRLEPADAGAAAAGA